jgi:hypothetical protein
MSKQIKIDLDKLDEHIRNTANQAIMETLDELGIKRKPTDPWVSENYAVRVMEIGRVRLKRAVARGVVKSKTDLNKKTHNKFVLKADVNKLLKNPIL